ncbi:hypothetical protein RIF29_41343 [Crotalaria pallida]|uniref:Uncharacterized protein n=1 Tax=Crotalaria pallida TaxID=3830 RepID=A0AAN9EAD3_CROPI
MEISHKSFCTLKFKADYSSTVCEGRRSTEAAVQGNRRTNRGGGCWLVTAVAAGWRVATLMVAAAWRSGWLLVCDSWWLLVRDSW